jgi:two-component system probable response regulator PhcQ
MHTPQDYRDFAILYVDDESQALKYFKKAMEKDFEVFTAGSAAEGQKILDQSGDKIGILICDQRMPGEKGTELLARMRNDRPGIVRILTTAYSDLESAIEAVNSGAVYKYVVKPWDLRDLRGILLRAMDFFLVQRQRDLLLREKLTVLQRMVVSDRIRGLAVLAAGLSHHIRNSMAALKAFLDSAPVKLREEVPQAVLRDPAFWQETLQSAQTESRRVLELVDRVSAVVVHPSREFSDTLDLAAELREAADRLAPKLGDCRVDIRADRDLPQVRADRAQVQRVCEILLARAAALNGASGTVRATISGTAQARGTPGVRISVEGNGDGWRKATSADVFSAIKPDSIEASLDALSAFFIAHHHGGEMRFEDARFEVVLPADPLAVEIGPPDAGFLDDLFGSLYLQERSLAARTP